eukprot:TRINITY_DN6157_c0_g1_i1.p1 TRINITY_DN6157_c0_g1~~TRINITY_DN6157_c0_g1_i1.p1  ORF type:complete len:300 (+),score=63.50 TRINITY_DN6157_c0_g1_i1:791-1690(+)
MSDPLMKMTKKWKVKPTKVDRTSHAPPAKLEECQFSWNLEEAGVQEAQPQFRPTQYLPRSPVPSMEDCRSLSRQRSMPNMKKLTDHALMIEKARQQVQQFSFQDQNHPPPHQSPPMSPMMIPSSPIPTALSRPIKRHKSFNSFQEVVPAALVQEMRNGASAPVSAATPSSPLKGQFQEPYDVDDEFSEFGYENQSPLVRSQSDGAPASQMRRKSSIFDGPPSDMTFYTNVNLNGLMSAEFQNPSVMIKPAPREQDQFLSSLTSRFHQFQPINTTNQSAASTATAGFCGAPRSPSHEMQP